MNWSELEKILFIFIFGALLIESAESKMFDARSRVIDVDTTYSYNDTWTRIGTSEEDSLREIIKLLKNSSTGKKILLKAASKAAQEEKSLMDIIVPGEGSLTDTTLIRKFSPSTPDDIHYETRSKVYLNRRLSVRDATLDLAHELTHYVFRNAFNPYRGQFTLQDFIVSTIEGRGGEVDAYMIECRVLYELFPKDAHQHTNCNKVMDQKTGELSRDLGVQQFYRVGRHIEKFKNKMQQYSIAGQSFPYVKGDEALFISSAYGVPYPIAAISEYEIIMQKACENDSKRLGILKQKVGRSIASNDAPPVEQELFERMSSQYKNRCQNFAGDLRASR